MLQVRETAAGKAIGAWIILDRRGREVATLQAHYANAVMVDCWAKGHALQQGRAGGYGYDKFTAALSGMVIDGHKMTDHCGERQRPPKGSTVFPRDFKPRKGYSLANWSQDRGGYTDCYRESGLDYLKALGYRVLQAI